jgi:hypothetical protein
VGGGQHILFYAATERHSGSAMMQIGLKHETMTENPISTIIVGAAFGGPHELVYPAKPTP